MKFSKRWLDEWLEQELPTEHLVARLNQSGLEVDSVNPASQVFEKVVVARVDAVSPHPDAKKLSVCAVNIGTDERLQVVCGADNVRPGLKVALIMVGGKLGKDFEIKATELHGVLSQGMLCSATELGLEESSQGILELPEDATIGQSFAAYLGLPDEIIEIDLTPNRGDCLGLKGLAREVAAIAETGLKPCAIAAVTAMSDETLPVSIKADEACVRYSGRVIKGVNLAAPTPVWLSERLRRSGIRGINIIVDVTNYVMLELGQPMHAFDLAKISGEIQVRQAQSGETLKLLDERDIELTPDALVIADQTKPLALAGIMGGYDASVTAATQDVFLESATFTAAWLAGKARQYSMHTDASHRFERGVDPSLTRDAIERATKLIIDIAGGTPGAVIDVKTANFNAGGTELTLRYPQVQRILGTVIPREAIHAIFSRLGFSANFDAASDTWQVTVPSFRFDISIEADLIEEIARLYGYDNIQASMPRIAMTGKPVTERMLSERTVYDFLRSLGLNEMIAYSFVSPEVQAHFNEVDPRLRLANPIASDLSEMRMSLWPGLIEACRYNRARRQHDVRLFESGLVFAANDNMLSQTRYIGGILTGDRHALHWSARTESVDFYDGKGVMEGLLSLTKAEADYRFQLASIQGLHPGQSAHVLDAQDQIVGRVGVLHPALEAAFDLKGPVVLFELDWRVFHNGALAKASAVSKFPIIRRDLAILVRREITGESLLNSIRCNADEYYYKCDIFDVYQGDNIAKDKKSVAIAIHLQSFDKTFTDELIQQIMERILHALKSEYGAELRE